MFTTLRCRAAFAVLAVLFFFFHVVCCLFVLGGSGGCLPTEVQVHSIMGQMSLKFDTPMEDLCSRISWPLYRKFGHAYDAFQMAER